MELTRHVKSFSALFLLDFQVKRLLFALLAGKREPIGAVMTKSAACSKEQVEILGSLTQVRGRTYNSRNG